MQLHMLKSKLHRVTVTEADLNYEGSVSIDPTLIDHAQFFVNERVDIYNCNTGARFSTYVIPGKTGEICLNGAAARLVQKGDILIIAAFCIMDQAEAMAHKPRVVFVDDKNKIKGYK
jgi:aspartate 1-decarboxylase